jgi:Rrf2 family transcriptional repressor of oqxAB
MIDLRFPTALQMMLTLAYAHEQGAAQLTSTQLAYGIGSTPSFVRRLLVPLRRDQLITSTKGKLGGVALARSAQEIRLSEIYSAVVEDKTVLPGRPNIPHRCAVSSRVEEYFKRLSTEAADAVVAKLGERTLNESLAELLAMKVAAA